MKQKSLLVLCLCLLIFMASMPAFAQTATPWQVGILYHVGDLVTFNGQTFKCVLQHTSQADWAPGPDTQALWMPQAGPPPACNAVPNAPTGLTAPAASITTNSATLNWTAATVSAGCTVTGYSVLKNGVSIGTTTNTTFPVTGLTPATTFSFTVTAADSVGTSAPSAPLSLTTPNVCTTVPGTPTGLAAVANSITSSGVTLTWNPVTPGANCLITYTVFQNGAAIGTTTNTTFPVSGLAAATTFGFAVAASDVAGAGAKSGVFNVTTLTPPPPPPPPVAGPDQLSIVYTPTTDDGTNFTGTLTVSNPNATYAWNGSFFDIVNIPCTTTAQLTKTNSPNGPPPFTNQAGGVTFNLTFQSMFGLGQSVPISVQGTDGSGGKVTFNSCTPNYVRGPATTAFYPLYAGLPASWQKNKQNLSAADLIADQTSYYQATLPAVTDKMIIYHPPHPTQVELNQTMSMSTPVNAVNNLRIWIPSKFMAMGLGFAYEFFKFNPNFLTGIGTKENFAAGLAPPAAGLSGNPVMLGGTTYSWPIAGNSPDGPFQQETGNFNDMVSMMPDYLPPGANHGSYVTINVTSTNRDDPTWVSATISSALSLTVTRETLNAIPANSYLPFIQQMKDPWGEQAITAFAYNRGAANLLSMHILTANRAQALASQDIATDFGLAGFGSYVATVRAVTDALNNDTTNTYDVMLTSADITTFFTQVRKFYANGVPNDTDFAAMQADVQRAFTVLAAHWGGNTISFRYDFLTLLRVAKQYLPQPYNPRPTGSSWYFMITNANP